MHSSLRKELCGTLKIVKAVRPRPTSRPFTARRKFTSQTRLLNQGGPRDNNGSPASSADRNDPSSNVENPAHGFGTEIEKWIQILSDQGQSPQIWDAVTEKDENGRRRLLPQIRKDLEDIGDWAAKEAKDGESMSNLALKIEDGRIRPVKLGPSEQADGLNATPSILGGRVGARRSNPPRNQAVEDAQQASTAATSSKPQQPPAQDADRISEQQLAEGGENPPPELDSTTSTKFYGSSTARRQRERLSRNRDKSHVIILPKWFIEYHVLLAGEGCLQLSAPHSIEPILSPNHPHHPDNRTVAAAEATPVERLDEASSMQEIVVKDAEAAPPEKRQTRASGAEDPPPSSDSSGPVDPGKLPDRGFTSSHLLKEASSGYHIHSSQMMELVLTIQGRLRFTAGGFSPPRLQGSQHRLMVHYTASDGDLLLDRLIEDIARELQCNLIALDAQDISSLVAKTEQEPNVIEEARSLSYHVYGDMYAKKSEQEDHPTVFAEEMEDDEEESKPGPRPFMIGKAINITDLSSALMGSRGPRHSGLPFISDDMTPGPFGRGSLLRSTQQLFSSLVDSILSSPQYKQKVSPAGSSEGEGSDEAEQDNHLTPAPKGATIVHVKAYNAMMDSKIGRHFLSQLSQQVSRRRSNGENILIVGTECAKESSQNYDADRIRDMQSGESQGTTTIVLTPGFPNDHIDAASNRKEEANFRSLMQRDRAKRIQIINARHLYEMLKSDGMTNGLLKDGFWTRDLSEELDSDDLTTLSKNYWDMAYVQRIAAILSSSEVVGDSSDYAKSMIFCAVKILEISDTVKESWVLHTQSQKQRLEKKSKSTDEPENDKLAQIRSKASRHEKKLLSGVVEPKKMATTFQDIHIPPETVDALQTLTTLSLIRPDAFKYGVLASDRIPGLLLYGPPGTGKTLAAKAVARESGATMLEVSAADINDMYVGEGEKNVKALFSLAKKLSPCVVFLDEADAMFSARSAAAGRRVSHRELLNQFLREWDGMNNDSGSAFIMVATNRPMDLDDAVLRRLPRRLLVDLPAEKDRLEILKIHLRHENLAEDVNLANLASRTQFYSGSDLKNVAVAAALNCVREENEAAKKHTGEETYQHPVRRTLTSSHFDNALEEITASISDDMASLREIKKFDEQYGDRKGRKRKSPKWGFKTASEADAVLDTVKVRS